ncbi:MAG: ribonuclease Z [Candidatus Woesearchaeota archaeon]
MPLEITFLGTGSMVPTKERNVIGMFLSYKNKGMLFDCGEGTQRQMNLAGINRNKVNYVFLSHWHGDHVSGLIGLIQTLGNQQVQNEERPTLHIFGPKETEERMEHMLKTCIFENKVILEIHELNPKRGEILTILENEDFYVQTARLDHSVPCLGYSFIEKDVRRIDMGRVKKLGLKEGPVLGKIQNGEIVKHEDKLITPEMISDLQKGLKITVIMDTGLCEMAIALAKDADLLICEATFSSELGEKAENYKHMTAKDAALLANNANAKRLIITHISQRYKTTSEILDDAKNVHNNVEVAHDFMKVKL